MATRANRNAPRQSPNRRDTIEVRAQRFHNLQFLPDPRGEHWIVPLNESVMESAFQSQNITNVLTKIARLVDPEVVIFPRVKIERKAKPRVSVDFSPSILHLPELINGLGEGRFAIGQVHFFYEEPSRSKPIGHSVNLVVKHTNNGKQYYLVDSNGIMRSEWGRQLPIILRSGLRAAMDEPNLDLYVFDTKNANFKPSPETRTLLMNEFGLENIPDMALCNTFAVCYAFELICTSEVGPDADRLTRFLYRDLCRRSRIYSMEKHVAHGGTLREFTPREEAEVMLYARALAFGMLRHLLPDRDIPLLHDVAQPIANEPTVTVRRTWASSSEPMLENANR